MHSARPEGCGSESLGPVYFDVDKKPHIAVAGPWDAEEARNFFPLPVVPVP